MEKWGAIKTADFDQEKKAKEKLCKVGKDTRLRAEPMPT